MIHLSAENLPGLRGRARILASVITGSLLLQNGLQAGEPGKMTREVWTNVSGTKVSDLTVLPSFHGGANSVGLINSSVAPTNAGDNFGSRMRGFIIAPVTGDYTFWESADDEAELWFSPSADKFDASLVAWHHGWTNALEWSKFESQKSPTIRLQAGEKHYVELRHKEGGGGDHLAMAWDYREVQPSVNLALLPGVVSTQSSQYGMFAAGYAVDGNTGGDVEGGDGISHTQSIAGSWWQADLGEMRSIERLVLWNREGWNGRRLSNFRVSLLGSSGETVVSKDFFTNGTHAGLQVEWLLDGAVNARTVKVERIGVSIGGENILTLAEVQVFGVEAPHPVTSENLTQRAGVTATQSSTYGTWIAPYAIDGCTGGDTAVGDIIAHTQSIAGSWWQVDLGAPHALDRVVIWNREGWNGRRLSNFRLSLLGSGGEVLLSQDFFTDGTHAARQFEWVLPAPVRARTVKLQRIGASAGGENIINIAEVEVFGSTNRLATAARQVIPPAYLESYDPQPEDLDDDDLLDAWELAHGFDPSTWQAGVKSHDADPDRDYLTNHQESMLGLDPFTPDSVRGFLSHEQRLDVPYYSVREAATASDKIYQAADFVRVVEESSTGEHQLWDVSQSLRGYIEAPTTGDYHFWISATNGAQLLLSTGDDKYHKRIIAEMGPEMGTEHGVWYGSPTKWDSFACQMSQAVRLEAGQKYFIEVRHQHGHGHYPHADIAWARPAGDREVIPREFLHSYHHLAADDDDDSLPDAWEEDNGLSVTDNGLSDRAKEGEDGDFDGDGLSNRAEYVAGTDPSDIDSDNDGLSDLDELRTYGTDPTVSDASGELVVQTVPASSVSGLGTHWTATADGVMTASFRGAGAWNFSVPSAGYWIVQVEGQLRGDLRAEEVVPVEAGVDGVGIGRQSMTFLNSAPGSLRIITPWLSAGSHQLDLFIDNYTARRMVEILSIKVLNPGGLDLDSNGRSDAIERQLGKVNQILPGTVVESWISPAFVEGLARSTGGVEFRHRHEGVGSAIRHKDSFWDKQVPGIQSQLRSLVAGMAANPGSNHEAAGNLLPTAAGPGHGTWHAGVPLHPNQATGYSAFFENGSLAGSGVIVWRPLNLFEVEELSIPLGTSLLMSAWDGESDNSRLEFTIAGTSHEIRALDSLSWEFGTAGDHVVSVLHQKSGEILTLTVHVREAELPGGLTVAENRYATVNLPGVATDLALDANGELGLGTMVDLSAGGSKVVIAGMVPGPVRIAARMAARDPILDLAEVTVVGISDALRHQNSIVTPAGDGMTLVRSPLLVTYLPPGATVRISIFAGGVTFTDGTTVRILTSADFDENGVLMIEMLMPADRLGAPCHSIEIFDAAGNKIFQ